MEPCPHCDRPMRAGAERCDYCRKLRSEAPNREPVSVPPPVRHLSGFKLCRKCGREKPLGFFPQDRSRYDRRGLGRWHTCTLCHLPYWRERGKLLAFERKLKRQLTRESLRTYRSGLLGLRKGPRKGGIDALPPDLQREARLIRSNSIASHKAEGQPLNQQQIAAITGSAVSNAWRAGDSAWGRRMLGRRGSLAAQRQRTEQMMQRMEQETPGLPTYARAARPAGRPGSTIRSSPGASPAARGMAVPSAP